MTTIRPHANARHRLTQLVSTLIAIVLFAAQLCAQQPAAKPVRPAVKSAPPILETLLSDDSYKVYGEVRNVGQLLSTGGAGEIIEPIMKLADPPREFTALVKFLNANADTLAASRLMFATWPARTGIPNAFVVIELASAEEAVKFEPKLNRLLPLILPTPTPTPTLTPTPPTLAIDEKTATVAQETPTPAALTSQGSPRKRIGRLRRN